MPSFQGRTMSGKVPPGLGVLIILIGAAVFSSPAWGRDLDDAFEDCVEVLLGSLGPIEQGTYHAVDHKCETAVPIVRPSTGVVRAQALVEQVEIEVDTLDPEGQRAVLTRAIFASPAIVVSTLFGPTLAEAHIALPKEGTTTFADLLTFPDLEVEFFDISSGRLRLHGAQQAGGEYDIEIVDIRVQGQHLDSLPSPGQPRMMLVGSGRVDEDRGRLSFQCFASPGDGVADFRFGVGLDEFDATLLNPFIVDEVDFTIGEGKISLLVNGNCREGRFLHTDNHLILEGIRIESGSEAGVGGLTLSAVAGMLGGTLSVEFPVDGDLLDPDFDLAESYAQNALLAGINQTADALLSQLPAKNRIDLKKRLLEWVAPGLPDSQKKALLQDGG
jgi:hypothetical protein